MQNINIQNQLLFESKFSFIGISKNKKIELMNILSYCKEIRNTAYPMDNSLVSELEIVEFTARKEKDHYFINGSLSLVDGEQRENRSFEAYIFENIEEGKTRVYMDVTRYAVHAEPKMIRTTEELIEDKDNIIDVTIYASSDSSEQKTYSEEFCKNGEKEEILINHSQQLSAL